MKVFVCKCGVTCVALSLCRPECVTMVWFYVFAPSNVSQANFVRYTLHTGSALKYNEVECTIASM